MLSFEVSIVNSKFSALNSISCYILITYAPKLMWYTVHPKKQVSRAGTINYIPQYPWYIVTCPCPWYQPLAHQSPIIHRFTFCCVLLFFQLTVFFLIMSNFTGTEAATKMCSASDETILCKYITGLYEGLMIYDIYMTHMPCLASHVSIKWLLS